MSGFEVVGVVLGSLPLIISAIEHYTDLVQTVNRAIKYKIELKNLKHDLNAESIVFLDTIERVLDGLIPAKQLEELLEDPASTLWQDDTLNERLQDRLGRSYDVFTHTVNDMNATIRKFIKRLDIDDEGKVRWTESTGLRLALKRAGFSLRKRDFNDLIEQLQKNNRYLEKFTNRSIEFEPSRQRRKRSSKFQKLGDYAKSVFNALEASFRCDCQGSSGHLALFGLAPRPSHPILQPSKQEEKIGFQVVISGISSEKATSLDEAITWQEVSLEPAEENSEHRTHSLLMQCPMKSLDSIPINQSKPIIRTLKSVRFFEAPQIRSSAPQSSTTFTQIAATTSTQSTASISQSQPSYGYISSMCKLICTPPASAHPDCLGYILDGDRKFFLYPRARSSAPCKKVWSTISLRQILYDTAVSAPPLTPWDRLSLAATIASAVLQFHSSPWLKSAWNSADVLFLQREGERLYEQAFVANKVRVSGKTAVKPSQMSFFNDTLLALATVLVELSLGPLETLQTPEDLQAGPLCSNMITLWRLVDDKKIEIIFGPRYQSAVKRCIELARASSALDEQVQQDLYDGVVSVLEDQAMRKDFVP